MWTEDNEHKLRTVDNKCDLWTVDMFVVCMDIHLSVNYLCILLSKYTVSSKPCSVYSEHVPCTVYTIHKGLLT